MWERDSGSDVTAAFIGITTPVRDLYDEIHQRGWTVSKVDIKDGQFLAEGKNPYGETLAATGPTDSTALSNLLVKVMRREWGRSPVQQRVGMWQGSFSDLLPQIAKSYAEAKVYDPKAASAWMSLAKDNERRAAVLGEQLHVEVVDEPEPYESIVKMCEDVHKKQHIFITRAMAHHPLWSRDQVVAFRLVHDVLGHCVAGGDWGWHGINQAFAAHAPLVGFEEQKALFTETVGQGAYGTFYRALGPQKVVFLDDVFEEAQARENGPGHAGVHPGQTIAPTEFPKIPKDEEKTASLDAGANVDPNHDFQTGIDPLPDNAFLWHRVEGPNGSIDPLDHPGIQDSAANLHTNWHALQRSDGRPDHDTQRQAVVNALRATLLTPRHIPQATAQHYQGLLHVPATMDDPVRLYDILDRQRDLHNQARSLPPGWHQLDPKDVHSFKQWVKGLHPELPDNEIDRVAHAEMFHMLAEEEESASRDDTDNQMSTDDVEKAAMRTLQRRLRVLTKGRADQKYDFGESRLYHEAVHDIKPYYAPLASHLKNVAALGTVADKLLAAAREDVRQHGGRGHHWRKEVLKMNLPGVGPEQASHAWLFLQPHTSDLAPISPQILDTLGHKPQHMNQRDYFKFERELHAGRDASGYQHVPLGQFTWGLFDHMNYGPGVHLDHSHVRPLDPAPHTEIDWTAHPQPQEQTEVPPWWEATEDARNEIGKGWDRLVAINTPSDQIPYQPKVAGAFSTFIPLFTHPQSGEVVQGAPGKSLMQHLTESLALSTPEIWGLNVNAEKQYQ